MKKFRQTMALAIVLGQVFLMPGLGMFSAMAQSFRAPTRVAGSNRVGGMVSGSTFRAPLGGDARYQPGSRASLQGSLGNRTGAPSVTNSNAAAIQAEFAGQSAASGEAPALPGSSARSEESAGIAPSLINHANAATNANAANQMPAAPGGEQAQAAEALSFIGAVSAVPGSDSARVSDENAAGNGRIAFDRMTRTAPGSETPSVEGFDDRTGSPIVLKAPSAGQGSETPAGTPAPAGKADGPSKWQTAADLTVAFGLAAAAQQFSDGGTAAALTGLYSGLATVGLWRYSQDFVALLKKKEWGGAAKAAAFTFMAGVLAPVALVVDGVQQLAVPFLKAVWKAVKNVAIFIKDLAVSFYENILVPAWNAVKQFAKDVLKAVGSALKAFGRWVAEVWDGFLTFVGEVITTLADWAVRAFRSVVQFFDRVLTALAELAEKGWQAVVELAIAFYENVLTPLGHAARGLGAGLVAGFAAAFILPIPTLGAAALNFVVQPLHRLFTGINKLPIGFRIGAYLALPALLIGGAVVAWKALAGLAALTVSASVTMGLVGGAYYGVTKGYRGGFLAGVTEGIKEASKVAWGWFEKSKTNYQAWRMNIR